MDGRCATCDWWESKDGTWGKCINVEGESAQLSADCMIYVKPAYLNWVGPVMTRNDFGCVQWQPKESE